MTAVLATPPFIEFNDDDGNPLSGGLIYTYAAGTLVPKATFTTAAADVEMSNPIELDASGRAVWFIQGAYKYIVKDRLGNTIKTVDNVISFSTLADAAAAFFQSFSGNGSQTAFTLSSDLGTDSKNLMVFLNKGLEQHVANGNFATDTIWSKGAGWTIAAGVATATGAISTAISQTSLITLVPGQAYAVTYTITRSAGGLIPSIGGQNGTERTASGTYREVIIAGSSQTLAFTGNAFTGTLDDVSVTVADSAGYDIVNPSAYTLNGTALTFATAPAVGTNNIYVFAPSTLLGAASAAAALAQGYATDAAASATAAASSATMAALSIKWKPAVACMTTANITLSGEQTIDGVLTSASRVLVKNQTNPIENGVYVSAAGAWARATDCDTWTELLSQAVTATGGTVNNKKTYVNTNEAGGTIGIDAINWTELLVYPAPNSVSTVSIQDAAVTTVKLGSDIIFGLPCDFRLSLTTALPVTTSDVTAATTIYCVPYKGNRIALYNGTAWVTRNSAEFSIALGTITSGRPYDVFCYDNSGTPTLEILAWTNDSTRATALAYQNGILIKSGDATRRYLGSFYTTSTTTTEDSIANRYLYNYYNRVRRKMQRTETTASWTYTTTIWRQANASTSNQLNFMVGVAEDTVTASLVAQCYNSNASVGIYNAIGLDSTTTPSTDSNIAAQFTAIIGHRLQNRAQYSAVVAAGKHSLVWLEESQATGTTTFEGESAGVPVRSILQGEVFA